MASLDPSLLADFTETITVRQKISLDAFGKPTYDAGVEYPARWVKRSTMAYRIDGETIRADGELWFGPSSLGVLPTFEPNDTITLPDGTEPRILAIEIYDDGVGLDHVKVLYGRLGQR